MISKLFYCLQTLFASHLILIGFSFCGCLVQSFFILCQLIAVVLSVIIILLDEQKKFIQNGCAQS